MYPTGTPQVTECEVITDVRSINLFNFAFVGQLLIVLHLGFGLIYAILGLRTNLVFDFLGMRDFYAPVFAGLVVLQALFVVLYERRMRTNRVPGQSSGHGPKYICGKTMIHTVKMAQARNYFFLVLSTLLSIHAVEDHDATKIELADVSQTLFVLYGAYFAVAALVALTAIWIAAGRVGYDFPITPYVGFAITTALVASSFVALLLVRGQRAVEYVPETSLASSEYIKYQVNVLLYSTVMLFGLPYALAGLSPHLWPLTALTQVYV